MIYLFRDCWEWVVIWILNLSPLEVHLGYGGMSRLVNSRHKKSTKLEKIVKNQCFGALGIDQRPAVSWGSLFLENCWCLGSKQCGLWSSYLALGGASTLPKQGQQGRLYPEQGAGEAFDYRRGGKPLRGISLGLHSELGQAARQRDPGNDSSGRADWGTAGVHGETGERPASSASQERRGFAYAPNPAEQQREEAWGSRG